MIPSLIIVLALQLTGVWSHLDTSSQTRLTQAAVTQPKTQSSLSNMVVPIEAHAAMPLDVETASSAYAIDTATGQVLYAYDATKPRPIASVTKLMTIMVALDALKPSDTVTVGQLPDYQIEDETMGLKTGQQFKVLDLVKATLIASDNDAADALGVATSGNLPAFYKLMNAKAAVWGIPDAHFASASGLVDQNNAVSAQSLAKIAALDLTSPLVRATINTQEAFIKDTAGVTYDLKTTNSLLATGHFYGIKTGYTEAAGQCFVGLTKIDGHEVITVVLGSSDRFGETQSLVNWIGSNWTWQ